MNYLGFEKDKLESVVDQLNALLANYHVYYQNLRNFHWNTEGENFFDLHEKFEDLYNDAQVKIDEIAERILTLRHRPLSRFSDYLAKADIEEAPILKDDYEMVETVLTNHKIIIANMRSLLEAADECKDSGTDDMIGGFLEQLEKASWMLDAWAAKKLRPATA